MFYPQSNMNVTLKREMAITHDEFLRIFKRAFAKEIVSLEPELMVISLNGERAWIRLLSEKKKKIGSLEWVVTDVELDMGNVPQSGVDRFLAGFDQAFQKGGG